MKAEVPPVRGGLLEGLLVERLAWGGDGVARAPDGRVVFVRGALPGQRVLAKIVTAERRMIRAQVTTVVEDLEAARWAEDPGPEPCVNVDRCGGCRFQGVSPSRTLAALVAAGEDTLRRLAREVPLPPSEVIASPEVHGYRERARLRVDRQGRSGFMSEGTREVSWLRGPCLVLHPALERARLVLGPLLRGLGDELVLRLELDALRQIVVAELSCEEGQLAALEAQLRRRLGAEPPAGLSLVLRSRRRVLPVLGDGRVHRDKGPLITVEASGQFAQAHGVLNRRLRAEVVACARLPDRAARVVELFAGAGNFSFALAEHASSLLAVDHAGEATAAAREAAKCRGIEHLSFLDADLSSGPSGLLSEALRASDVVVLDPPRGGVAEALLHAISDGGAERMVHVSCDPPALARDISRLHARGWVLSRLQWWEMFPRTAHLEALAVLERSSSGHRAE